jgi:hypothetical protein
MARRPLFDWFGLPFYRSWGQAPLEVVQAVRVPDFTPVAVLEPHENSKLRRVEEDAMPGILDRYGERLTRRVQQSEAVAFVRQAKGFDPVGVARVVWGDGSVSDLLVSDAGWREVSVGEDGNA